jgi:hypothetical protein
VSAISHIYKDVCGLAQAKGLPSLIYHEPVLEVRFMRGAAGTTRILTIRSYGSVRGAISDRRPYPTLRDSLTEPEAINTCFAPNFEQEYALRHSSAQRI